MLYNTEWETKVETKLEPWQEILLKAADVLRTEGWCRGTYSNGNGYCAVGSLRKALGVPMFRHLVRVNYPDYFDAYDALSAKLGTDNISYWNDFMVNSVDDVIKAMQEAAHAV